MNYDPDNCGWEQDLLDYENNMNEIMDGSEDIHVEARMNKPQTAYDLYDPPAGSDDDDKPLTSGTNWKRAELMRPRSYQRLSSYKCYHKADMIDLARVVLNQYSLSDHDYNIGILIASCGHRDIYSSDLISIMHSYAGGVKEEKEDYRLSFLEKRQERYRNRTLFRAAFRHLWKEW